MKAKILAAVFLLPLIIFFPAYAGWGVITEIAFDESAPKWIEIYAVKDAAIGGTKLFHGYNAARRSDSRFIHALTFPDIEVSEGDHLIVDFNVKHDNPHSTGTEPMVFYATYPATTDTRPFSSQGALYLTAPDGVTWIDFVVFVREDTNNFYMENEYSTAASRGHWSPAPGELGPEALRSYVPGGGRARRGWSLQRRRDNVTGMPVNTNTAEDWKFRAVTRGRGYFASPPKIEDKVLVYPNPFYPDKGQSARIVLPENAEDETLRLRIYTADGVKVLDRDAVSGPLSWDGRNSDGRICASGIYFFHLVTDGRGRTGKITLIR